MDEVDHERFDYGATIRESEQIETRTGAEIWVDIIRPDTDEEVPTIMVVSPYYNTTVPMRGMAILHDGEPLSPGALEEVQFWSLYTDVVVPAGHRLAFRVSNAAGGTLGSEMGGTVRILTGPEGSRVNVPVAPPAGSDS